MKRRKKIMLISLIVLFLIFGMLFTYEYYNRKINNNIEKITMSWSNFSLIDSENLNQYCHYTISGGAKFYLYDEKEKNTDGVLIASEYNINDYTPYSIILTINNNSDFDVESTHLCGFCSKELIVTEINEETYWFGYNIDSKTQKSFKVLVWLKNDLNETDINTILSSFKLNYKILVNCTDKSNYNPKTFLIICTPK